MDKDTKGMLKKIIAYDGAILLLTLVVSLVAFREYTAVLIIALLLALVNFILNALITSLTIGASKRAVLIVFGTVVRVGATALIAVLLSKTEFVRLVAFLIGYGLHYIAVIIYGMTRNRQKRKKEVIE